jgi:hypothetical protein
MLRALSLGIVVSVLVACTQSGSPGVRDGGSDALPVIDLPSPIPQCIRVCDTEADCDIGVADHDSDNYLCVEGLCAYQGCNGDDECRVVRSDLVCRVVDGVRRCIAGCETAADCDLFTPLSGEDNYECLAGGCFYRGCNSDEECRESLADAAFECVRVGDRKTDCLRTCVDDADCERDRQRRCVGGFCLDYGCTSTVMCNEATAGEPYECRPP